MLPKITWETKSWDECRVFSGKLTEEERVCVRGWGASLDSGKEEAGC